MATDDCTYVILGENVRRIVLALLAVLIIPSLGYTASFFDDPNEHLNAINKVLRVQSKSGTNGLVDLAEKT